MIITNPKIERKKTDIARTEAKIAEFREKLRSQKQELKDLEDDEIVALFRKETLTEDALRLLRSQRKQENNDAGEPAQIPARQEKEEKTDARSEN